MNAKTLFNTSLIISLVSLSLVGCGEKTKTYTVEHLVENNELRTQVLQDCKDNKQSTENCANAQTALSKVNYESYSNSAFK